MAASSQDDLPAPLTGRPRTYYYCDKCRQGIYEKRYRCKDCPGAYDMCARCREEESECGSPSLSNESGDQHVASHEVLEYEAGYIDLEDFAKSAPCPVDVALSFGANLRAISVFEKEQSEKTSESGWRVGLADLMMRMSGMANDGDIQCVCISDDDAQCIRKVFKCDNVVDKVLVSQFMSTRDIVDELVLAGRYGNKPQPTRDQIEQRLVDAFSRLEALDLSDLHSRVVADYFGSLFCASWQQPDPITDAWLDRMQIALLDSGVQIAEATMADFAGVAKQPNDIRQVLVRLSNANEERSLLAWITPSSNGLIFQINSSSK
jgi:hypothetical protein